MKALFLNIIAIAVVLGAGASQAQYPEMTEEEIDELLGYTQMLPTEEELNFEQTPSACEPDDKECEQLYLNSKQFQGYMQAQQQPSPIYSWESGKCILDSEACAGLQSDWETWVGLANTNSLDFSQGANPPQEPKCINIEGTWFGLDPAYKCYEYNQ